MIRFISELFYLPTNEIEKDYSPTSVRYSPLFNPVNILPTGKYRIVNGKLYQILPGVPVLEEESE